MPFDIEQLGDAIVDHQAAEHATPSGGALQRDRRIDGIEDAPDHQADLAAVGGMDHELDDVRRDAAVGIARLLAPLGQMLEDVDQRDDLAAQLDDVIPAHAFDACSAAPRAWSPCSRGMAMRPSSGLVNSSSACLSVQIAAAAFARAWASGQICRRHANACPARGHRG
jgi:hypothetical protein